MGQKRIIVVLVSVTAIMLGSGRRVNADFTFGTPTNLGLSVNSSANEYDPSISVDGLELYFMSNRPGALGNDLYVTRRSTTGDDWEPPVNLGPPVNSTATEYGPDISSDGLSLYFNAWPGSGDVDLFATTRATKNDPWGPPVNLGPPINTLANESDPHISSDGLSLYFCDWGIQSGLRPGGIGNPDLWVATRASVSDPWGTPVNLGPPVNTAYDEVSPSTSVDGLVLFITSNRPGSLGSWDIWITTRRAKDGDWDEPVNLGPTVNSASLDGETSLSSDGSILYFHSDRAGGAGGADLWQVPIVPILDFNMDGIVDAADMCIMIDYWGTDEPLCDIGPMPWGDGVVDVQDLIVLAEHLFTYPGAVAYWKLDETEDNIAYDSVGEYDGTLIGSPVWQPDAGMVAGALQFDGVDDHVITDYVLEPANGPFSVLAWIKGGAPGQVVLSQMGKANWLGADPSEGTLMTELTVAGRNSRSLGSEAVITDGNWHRIGFVWDGSYRRLYVDGVVVAEDAQDNLDISSNGLYFGTGKTMMEPGTFFSGLIDDIRIYNRAVKP